MDVLHRFTGAADEFTAALRHHTPTVFRPTDPPVDLLPLDELDRWLDTGLLRVPYLQLVTKNGEIELPRFCPPRAVLNRIEHGYVDGAAVRRLLAEATATVLLRHVDQWHPEVHAFCAAMRQQLGRQVEAFCFVTPPGTQGRPVHRDDADVFVVQIAGAKTWHLYGGPAAERWRPGPVDSPADPDFTTCLQAGEVLYVPRGHAHRAVAAGQSASAHLSFTVREAGGAHLYATLTALLAAGADQPVRPIGEPALLAVADRLLTEARTTLAGLTARALLDQARAGMRAVADPTHPPGEPNGSTDVRLADLFRNAETAGTTDLISDGTGYHTAR